MHADAGDRRFEPRDPALQIEPRSTATDAEMRLSPALRGKPPCAFDLLEERPALLAERLGQRLECARPRGGVGDKAEIGFAQQDKLAVARQTPRQAVGKTDGERMRQDANAVRPAKSRRKRGHRPAHYVHGRVARRHRAPCALGLDRAPGAVRGRKPPRLRAHVSAERAKFRQRDEFVRIGREAEGDPSARLVERHARPVEQRATGRRRRRARRRAPGRARRPPRGPDAQSATTSGPEKPSALSASAASTKGSRCAVQSAGKGP